MVETAKMQIRVQQEEFERMRMEDLARQESEEERDRAKGEALRNAILKNAHGGVPWGGKGPQQSSSLMEVQAEEEVERVRFDHQIR